MIAPRFLLACSLAALCSCSTIVSHTSWPVTINSVPTGATLTVLNRDSAVVFQGTTPATVQLEGAAGYMRRGKFTIKLSLPGYTEKTFNLNAALNPWYLGNVFSWSVLGLVIDPATGAMWRLKRKEITENLVTASAPGHGPSMVILLPQDVKPEWKPYLEPVK